MTCVIASCWAGSGVNRLLIFRHVELGPGSAQMLSNEGSLSDLTSIIGCGLVVAAVLTGLLKVLMVFRASRMRALAAKWGFRYIGPATLRFSKVWFSSSNEVSPPLPASFPLGSYPMNDIRQVWNVIEGQRNGSLLLIFDSFVRGGKAGWYCTFIACQTRQNPFGTDSCRNCIAQTDG